MTAEIRMFQIFYDEASRASLDKDFEPLDNSKNERPDWYEYWPIRNYLLRNELSESVFYGFFSPRFEDKTALTGAKVKDFVRTVEDADVVTFSPFPCHGACFINVFEQGEFFHQGLWEVARQFLENLNPRVKLENLVTHSRNTVFSNYFVARPAFWKAWRNLLDRLFDAAENTGSPLRALLNSGLDYAKDDGNKSVTHMKIFVMERAVSYLLATGAYRIRNFPPFQMPVSYAFRQHLPDVIQLDALKIAFVETGDPHFRSLFTQLRDRTIANTWLAGRQAG